MIPTGRQCGFFVVLAAFLFSAAAAADSKKPIPAGAIGLAADVKAQAEAHDWKSLLDRCSPEHRKTQRDMGMDEAQYIAEMLGLHTSGNNITQGKTLTYKDLGRIRKVKIERFVWQGPWIAVTGKVTLAGDKVLKLTMMITKHEARFYLTGAVG